MTPPRISVTNMIQRPNNYKNDQWRQRPSLMIQKLYVQLWILIWLKRNRIWRKLRRHIVNIMLLTSVTPSRTYTMKACNMRLWPILSYFDILTVDDFGDLKLLVFFIARADVSNFKYTAPGRKVMWRIWNLIGAGSWEELLNGNTFDEPICESCRCPNAFIDINDVFACPNVCWTVQFSTFFFRDQDPFWTKILYNHNSPWTDQIYPKFSSSPIACENYLLFQKYQSKCIISTLYFEGLSVGWWSLVLGRCMAKGGWPFMVPEQIYL